MPQRPTARMNRPLAALTCAFLGLAGVAQAAGGCSETRPQARPTAPQQQEDLKLTSGNNDLAQQLAGKWNVTEIIPGDIAPGAQVYLVIAGNQLSGANGCNAFKASLTITPDAFSMGPPTRTRQVCPPAFAKTESDFMNALRRVGKARLTAGGELELLGGDQVLMRARK